MLSIYLCALIIWYKVIVQPGITSWGHYELQAIGGIKRNVLISVVKKRVKFGIMEIVSVKKSWVRSDCLFPVTMFSVFYSDFRRKIGMIYYQNNFNNSKG